MLQTHTKPEAARRVRRATPPANTFIYPDLEQLQIHPQNMRTIYPPEQVAEMAASLKANKGNLHALHIVPAPSGKFHVVDGNLRLAAARTLGAACPPLKCEIITATLAEQKLRMVVVNKTRHKPDVISEAKHYRSLMEENGLTVTQISQATGVAVSVIYDVMLWLDVEPEIQALVQVCQLPKQAHVARALLSVTPAKARLKLATTLAENGATTKVILAACAKYAATVEKRKAHQANNKNNGGSLSVARVRAVKTSALDVATTDLSAPDATRAHLLTWSQMREAASAACTACDVRLEALKGKVAEPAWALVAHAVGEVCGDCSLDRTRATCGACPAVDILRHIIRTAQKAQAGHAQAYLTR